MFNNTKDNKRDPADMSNGNTMIAKGTVLEGNIETFGTIRIEGKIIGYVKAQSKLVLGDSSVVEGNTFSQNAEIAGEVKGVVEVTDVLVLKSTAVVHGDIITGKLIVESGAIWNGNCKMGNAAKENSDAKEIKLRETINGRAEEQEEPVK